MAQRKCLSAGTEVVLTLGIAVAAAMLPCSCCEPASSTRPRVEGIVSASLVTEETPEGVQVRVTITNGRSEDIYVCTCPNPQVEASGPYRLLAQEQTLVLYWAMVHPLEDGPFRSHLWDLGVHDLRADVQRVPPGECLVLQVDLVSPIERSSPYRGDILLKQGYREQDVEQLTPDGGRHTYWEDVRRVCAVVGYWDKRTLLALGDVNKGAATREYVRSASQEKGTVPGGAGIWSLDKVSPEGFMAMVLTCGKEARLLETHPGTIDVQQYVTAGPIDMPPREMAIIP